MKQLIGMSCNQVSTVCDNSKTYTATLDVGQKWIYLKDKGKIKYKLRCTDFNLKLINSKVADTNIAA